MDKKLIIGIIIILILMAIYFYTGSATPENITTSPNLNTSNVSGILV
ncbi:MAG: hypothetical protein ACP5OJ_04545 [Methanothermobacter sp.]